MSAVSALLAGNVPLRPGLPALSVSAIRSALALRLGAERAAALRPLVEAWAGADGSDPAALWFAAEDADRDAVESLRAGTPGDPARRDGWIVHLLAQRIKLDLVLRPAPQAMAAGLAEPVLAHLCRALQQEALALVHGRSLAGLAAEVPDALTDYVQLIITLKRLTAPGTRMPDLRPLRQLRELLSRPGGGLGASVRLRTLDDYRWFLEWSGEDPDQFDLRSVRAVRMSDLLGSLGITTDALDPGCLDALKALALPRVRDTLIAELSRTLDARVTLADRPVPTAAPGLVEAPAAAPAARPEAEASAPAPLRLLGDWGPEAMLEVISAHVRNGLRDIWCAPNIPAKKLENACKSYKFSEDAVLLLCDNTVFGSASDSLLITAEGIFWKKGRAITWHELAGRGMPQLTRSEDGSEIFLTPPGGTRVRLFILSTDPRGVMFDLLTELLGRYPAA
jgi:hypothetical protein